MFLRGGRVVAVMMVLVCIGLISIYSARETAPNVPETHLSGAEAAYGGAIAPSAASSYSAAVVVSTHQKTDRQSAQATQMAQRFRSTQSYRSFIQSALADPTHGGHFYAYIAYQKCRQIAGIHFDTPPPNGSPQVALAQEELMKEIVRCDGVFDQFGEDQYTFFQQVMDTRGGEDPLMPSNLRALFAAVDAATAVADFARAQSTGDQHVIAAAVQRNLEALLPTWFGQSYDPAKPQLYSSAAGVVACELRGDCGSAYLNAGRCALAGDCRYQDYRQYIASSFLGKESQEYEAILAKMRQVVGVPSPSL